MALSDGDLELVEELVRRTVERATRGAVAGPTWRPATVVGTDVVLVDGDTDPIPARNAIGAPEGARVEVRFTPPLGVIVERYAGGSLFPPGVPLFYGGAVAPPWALLMNGAAVSRTTYGGLFGVIGVTFGVGDGTTTFNVPNVVSQFILGATAPGGTGGAAQHVLTTAELPAHTHGLGALRNAGQSYEVTGGGSGADWLGSGLQTDSAGSGSAHNNMPPYIGMLPIITI